LENGFTDDPAGRLDKVESRLDIQELAARYALAVDSRDVDAWLALFAPDVDCGRFGKGRDALRQFIEPSLRSFYRSVHLVCGHVIDFESRDRARGTVYCRAEHEDGGQWVVVPLIYFDTYVRQDGRWYFAKRGDRSWYSADVLDRPGAGGFQQWQPMAGRPPALPSAFPSWSAFWDRAEPGTIEALTSSPLPPADS
jgi:hypothetical protein